MWRTLMYGPSTTAFLALGATFFITIFYLNVKVKNSEKVLQAPEIWGFDIEKQSPKLYDTPVPEQRKLRLTQQESNHSKKVTTGVLGLTAEGIRAIQLLDTEEETYPIHDVAAHRGGDKQKSKGEIPEPNPRKESFGRTYIDPLESPIFKAALVKPTPWLPLHSSLMVEKHHLLYKEVQRCLKAERNEFPESKRRPNYQACLASGKAVAMTSSIDNDFQTNMLRLTSLRTVDSRFSFPQRWRENFDEETLRNSENFATPYAEQVIEAIQHSYDSYAKVGWGQDEVTPLSLRAKNWAGLSVTMIDSMSTLWLSGHYERFYEAADWVTNEFLKFDKCTGQASFFEISIRVLGGLLSAASLSGHEGLLKASELLGRRYLVSLGLQNHLECPWLDADATKVAQRSRLRVFGQKRRDIITSSVNEGPKHTNKELSEIDEEKCYTNSQKLLKWERTSLERLIFPPKSINLCKPFSGVHYSNRRSNLAEAGSFQMEFRALSMLTGDLRYKEVADHVTRNILQTSNSTPSGFRYLPRKMLEWGLSGGASGDYAIGSEADSYAEYLLKQWIQTGKTEAEFLALWRGIIDEIMVVQVKSSSSVSGVFNSVLEPRAIIPVAELDHLAIKLQPSSKFTSANARFSMLFDKSGVAPPASRMSKFEDILMYLRRFNGSISVLNLLKATTGFSQSGIPLATNKYMQSQMISSLADTLTNLSQYEVQRVKKFSTYPKQMYAFKAVEDDSHANALMNSPNVADSVLANGERTSEISLTRKPDNVDAKSRTLNNASNVFNDESLQQHRIAPIKDAPNSDKAEESLTSIFRKLQQIVTDPSNITSPYFSLVPALHRLYVLTLQTGTPLYQSLALNSSTLPNFEIHQYHSLSMEHLACFLPGSMWLAVMNQWEGLENGHSYDDSMIPKPSSILPRKKLFKLILEAEGNPKLLEKKEWVEPFQLLVQSEVAKSVLDACLIGYFKSKFVLGFEAIDIVPSSTKTPVEIVQPINDFESTPSTSTQIKASESFLVNNTLTEKPLEVLRKPGSSHYAKRPEVLESLYYLHYYTGDPKYRRIAASFFNSIQKFLKVKGGYASTGPDTATSVPKLQDGAESYFIAETLKYLFLIFSPPEVLNLDKFVMTTEGHPLPILSKGFGVGDSHLISLQYISPYVEI